MAANSNIEWCHHTFNPWIGCTKISPACDNCYAETWDQRFTGGARWGAKAERTRTKPANWNKPLKWNQEAKELDIRYRVFCASLADVFDNKVPTDWRDDLWALIRATPHLDWLLLTKRPQNISRPASSMLPEDWGDGYHNVWLGVTVENQDELLRRVPVLSVMPAALRFISAEPLLGPLQFPHGWINSFQWIIAGGESGPDCRDVDDDNFRLLRDQCKSEDIAFLFKQYSGAAKAQIKAKGRELDGVVWDEYPTSKER